MSCIVASTLAFLAQHLCGLQRVVERCRSHPRRTRRSTRAPGWVQSGQATAEYALVLLGVAAIALLLAAWAAKSGKIGELFDAVVDQLITKAK